VEKYGRARQATDDNITQRMRIACWITKTTDTHSEYITFVAFPRQQWLRERASILRYATFACLVIILNAYILLAFSVFFQCPYSVEVYL
jgi:hypothetical protein